MPITAHVRAFPSAEAPQRFSRSGSAPQAFGDSQGQGRNEACQRLAGADHIDELAVLDEEALRSLKNSDGTLTLVSS
jgi:hypothetical protein